MKILWLASWYPNPHSPYNGDFIQRHARALALYHPVTVFYISQSGEDASGKESTEQVNEDVKENIFFFNYRKTGFNTWDKLVYNWRYYQSYKKVIRNYIREEGVPDIVHVHVPMKAGIIARWIKRKWKVPFIVSEHSAHYGMGTPDDYFCKPFFHRKNVAGIFRTADAVTNVSLKFAETIRKIFLLNDIYIIRNTADTNYFSYQRPVRPGFRFIHVSTLNDHQKNIKGLLRSLRDLSKRRNDFELIIIGPASVEEKEMIRQLSLSKFVKLVGEVPYREVAGHMQETSALVLFSRYENFPCVIVEALCTGLPVISSDVCGIKEVINDSNGMLVQSENEKELTDAMSNMIDQYSKFNREQIAEKASEQFGYNTIGKQFFDLYSDILKKN